MRPAIGVALGGRLARLGRWLLFPAFPLDTRAVAGLLGAAVVLLVMAWSATMEATGSALDAHPSRWLLSFGFVGCVLAGTASGWTFWASWLPWRGARIGGAIGLSLATLVLFLASLGTGIWFEMYEDGGPLPHGFRLAVYAGVLGAILGWMLAVATLLKRALVAAGVGLRAWLGRRLGQAG